MIHQNRHVILSAETHLICIMQEGEMRGLSYGMESKKAEGKGKIFNSWWRIIALYVVDYIRPPFSLSQQRSSFEYLNRKWRRLGSPWIESIKKKQIKFSLNVEILSVNLNFLADHKCTIQIYRFMTQHVIKINSLIY